MKEKVAIIAGSTGLTGSLLLQELLKRSEFVRVKAITRRPLLFNDARVEEVCVNNLHEIHFEDPRFKADVYFCCLGTTIKKAGSEEEFRKVDFDAVKSFAEAAKYNDAQGFLLVSAMGADSQSLIFYNQVKGEAESVIRDLNLPGTVIFRPSLLVGDRKEERFAENLAVKFFRAISPCLPSKIKKSIGTKVEDLVSRMIQESLRTEKDLKIIEAVEI